MVDLIDLTADSPVAQQQQQPQQQPGAGVAPRTDFVDLLSGPASSPSKRRHGTAQQACLEDGLWARSLASLVIRCCSASEKLSVAP
jgi:hypothetical protein